MKQTYTILYTFADNNHFIHNSCDPITKQPGVRFPVPLPEGAKLLHYTALPSPIAEAPFTLIVTYSIKIKNRNETKPQRSLLNEIN